LSFFESFRDRGVGLSLSSSILWNDRRFYKNRFPFDGLAPTVFLLLC
jgi:hypothetical protein